MSKAVAYTFAGMTLDVGRRLLLRGDEPLALQKKPLDLLIFLIEHRDRAVDKEEILRSVWPDEIVSDSSLAVSVAKIRKAVGDTAGNARVVETLHGFGYRFVAPLEGELPSMVEPAGAVGTTPATVVGRERDMAVLSAAWERARAAERQLVFVSGEAGIGKTALVQAFVAEVAEGDTDAWIMHGDCLDLHGGCEPFLPLLDAWSRTCRAADGAIATDVLRRSAPGWLLQLHGVAAADERRRLQDEARGTMPDRMLRMLGNAFTELAGVRPVVLVLEDLHWADRSTLDALTRIARDREPAALLVVATLRPDFTASSQRALFDCVTLLQRAPFARELALQRLESTCTASFLANEAVGIEATTELCDALFDRTGGHPLFLQSAVRHLAAGGRLDEVPPDLRRMIEVEIDALGADEQRLVEVGGIIGPEFAAALVAAALDRPLADVEEMLLQTARSRRILEVASSVEWPDGTTSRRFRFSHPYYAEVVLDRTARSRQRGWHQRVGARLRDGYPGGLPGTVAMRVARHFEQAGDVDAAVTAYERAVAAAQEECSYERIEAAALPALALLARLPEGASRNDRELGLRMALGPALLAIRGYAAPEVEENCQRGLEVARAAGAIGPQFFALLTLSAIYQTVGDDRAARACVEELVELSERSLPPLLQTVARGRLGQVLVSDGELAQARRYLEETRAAIVEGDALQSLGAAMWVDPSVTVHGYLGCLLQVMGFADQARREMDCALARARELGRPFSLATAHLFAACLNLLARDGAATRATCRELIDIVVREGLMEAMGRGEVFAALADLTVASDRATTDRVAARIAAHQERRIRLFLPLLHCFHADALAQQGRFPEGLAALDAARERIDEGGERVFLAEVHRLRGALLAASGDGQQGAAEAEFIAAIDVARTQGALLFELRATVARARLLRRLGRNDEARASLRAVHDLFAEGFDSVDLQEASALLAELA